MSDLPPSWEWATLGEILERIEAGKSFSGDGRPASPDEWGVIKVSAMTYGQFREDENKAVRADSVFSEAAEIKPGDLLLSRANTRDYVGASVLVGNCRPRLLLSDKSLRLIPTEAVDRRWLWYALSSPTARQYISNASSGVKAGMRNISQESLRSMPLAIPPVAEQCRIVAALEDHLSRLDAAVFLLLTSQQKVPLALRSIFTAAVEGRLAAGSSSRNVDIETCRQVAHGAASSKAYREPVKPNLDVAPTVPTGWTVASLEATTDPVRVIRYGILKPRVHDGGVVPYIEVRDLTGGLAGKTLRTTSCELDEQFAAARVAPGDVVLAVRGSYDRSAVVPADFAGANISRDVVRIAPLPMLDPRYLNIFLHSSFAQGYLKRHARGVAVKGVNVSSIREIPIVFPDLPTQQKIVAEVESIISTVLNSEKNLKHLLAASKALRRSVLADAIAGRLVPQDPADEPASVLLERIRAERAAQPKPKRARRTTRADAAQGALL
jgi:type I restriction enzyme S subunit